MAKRFKETRALRLLPSRPWCWCCLIGSRKRTKSIWKRRGRKRTTKGKHTRDESERKWAEQSDRWIYKRSRKTSYYVYSPATVYIYCIYIIENDLRRWRFGLEQWEYPNEKQALNEWAKWKNTTTKWVEEARSARGPRRLRGGTLCMRFTFTPADTLMCIQQCWVHVDRVPIGHWAKVLQFLHSLVFLISSSCFFSCFSFSFFFCFPNILCFFFLVLFSLSPLSPKRVNSLFPRYIAIRKNKTNEKKEF